MIKSFKDFEAFRQILVSFPKEAWESLSPAIGSSIAINGVCLTVVSVERKAHCVEAAFDVSPETLRLTNLATLKVGDRVHFEGSLKVGQELGGHWVLGHVDGMGRVAAIEAIGEGVEMTIAVSGDFYSQAATLVVPKGSIAVDGVSLTINRIDDSPDAMTLAFFLIPHTLRETRFGNLKPGDLVNLELDLVGKYILRREHLETLRGPRVVALPTELKEPSL